MFLWKIRDTVRAILVNIDTRMPILSREFSTKCCPWLYFVPKIWYYFKTSPLCYIFNNLVFEVSGANTNLSLQSLQLKKTKSTFYLFFFLNLLLFLTTTKQNQTEPRMLWSCYEQPADRKSAADADLKSAADPAERSRLHKSLPLGLGLFSLFGGPSK